MKEDPPAKKPEKENIRFTYIRRLKMRLKVSAFGHFLRRAIKQTWTGAENYDKSISLIFSRYFTQF